MYYGIKKSQIRLADYPYLLQSILIAGLDINEAGVGGANVGGVELALTVASSVRVGGLGVNAVVGLDVGESLVHQAAVAALVAEAA
jgi:hypothetical protein